MCELFVGEQGSLGVGGVCGRAGACAVPGRCGAFPMRECVLVFAHVSGVTGFVGVLRHYVMATLT